MQPNPLYKATVAELEGVLPPRVVSRALREGLEQVSRDSATLEVGDLEEILKGAVFRHLQVTKPVEEARTIVGALLERLREAGDRAGEADGTPGGDGGDAAPATPAVGTQADLRLEALRAALRPFNLYFDWPEVRKLRAQAQVIEGELATGTDVEASFVEAESQLRLVEQKLEDQLVLQARDLGELDEALEAVRSLGGPRVRRLEALVGQIRQAQADRTLAEGEIERGRKLARDLRKLMESTVYSPDAPPDPGFDGRRRRADIPVRRPHPDAPDPAERTEAAMVPTEGDDASDVAGAALDRGLISPELSERLLRLDLESESEDVASAMAEHAELLRYVPSLSARFDALRADLARDVGVADALRDLRATLVEATVAQQARIERELDGVAGDLAALHEEVDATTLERALRVTRDVLAEGLPAHADVGAIRDLHRSALERSDELVRRDAEARERTAAQVRAQADLVERLDAALGRPGFDAAAFDDLRAELQGVREVLAEAIAAGIADTEALERGRRGEARWERAVAERAGDARERLRARLREFDARLSALPELGSVPTRAAGLREEVARLVDDDLLEEEHVAAFASLVDQLHAEAVAEVAHRLDTLGKEAGEAVGDLVLRELQSAARSLAAGAFPDLARLRVVIDQERAIARDRDNSRLQRLQLDATRLDAAGVDGVDRLRAALATARSELDAGNPATRHLDAAETAVTEIERQLRERLETFGGRLDAALAEFDTVERLNNDDVAAARRILTHLDSQRDAIGRVSPGLQNQLVASLAEAEALLVTLSVAFEATRAIADQLVSGSMLDDVLGFFGGEGDPFGASDDLVAPGSSASAGGAADSALAALVDAYRGLEDVQAVVVIDGEGAFRAGDAAALAPAGAGAPHGPLAAVLAAAGGSWDGLGAAVGGGERELVQIDLGARRAIVAPLGRGAHALVIVADSAGAPALAARLRDERGAFAAALERGE